MRAGMVCRKKSIFIAYRRFCLRQSPTFGDVALNRCCATGRRRFVKIRPNSFDSTNSVYKLCSHRRDAEKDSFMFGKSKSEEKRKDKRKAEDAEKRGRKDISSPPRLRRGVSGIILSTVYNLLHSVVAGEAMRW